MHLGYVNNTSAKSRQIFTLFHELAHLHFHTSGIDKINDSYINNLPDDAQKIEVFCNRFAAKFLVPDDYFWEIFAGKAPNRDIASELASLFKVSREVIYGKFLDWQLIDQQEVPKSISKQLSLGVLK